MAVEIQTNLAEFSLEQFLNMAMPPLNLLNQVPHVNYKLNNINWNNIIIMGAPNMGKSELGRLLMEEAFKRYADKLEPLFIPRHKADEFLNMPLLRVNKPIKVAFFDDLANKKMSEKQKDNWYRWRAQVQRQAKSDTGLLITILATQSYYALPKVVRENFFCTIGKSVPNNPSDERLCRRFFGEDGYSLLKKQTFDIILKKPHIDIAVFNVFGTIGYFRTPLAETDLLGPNEYNPMQ